MRISRTKLGLGALTALICLGSGALARPDAPVKADTLGLTVDAPLATDTKVPVVTVLGSKPGENKRLNKSYDTAPPMIPHAVADFLPIKRRNQCLECHRNPPKALRNKNITLIPESHFVGRDGKVQPGLASVRNVSGRFFACTLCHAAQTDAKPLVESGFKVAD